MNYIKKDQAFNAIIAIPESQASDVVNFTVRQASTGAVFASGLALHVAGILWKVQFTPVTNDVYVLWLENVTLDVSHSQSYVVVNSDPIKAVISESFLAVMNIPTTTGAEAVNYSIYRVSDGSVFASGVMNHLGNENWKVEFIPTIVDSYAVVATVTFLDGEEVAHTSVIEVSEKVEGKVLEEVTPESMLAAVEQAIHNRVLGGAVQSYSIGGRNLQYESLPQLQKMRQDLRREINASKGPSRNFIQFAGPI